MLDLEDPGAFRAASALSGGIARRGETCGALIGGIMAICQCVGRDGMEDKASYQRAMAPSDKMYAEFKNEIGHTLCAEIHKILYGRTFNLRDQKDCEAFRAAGGHDPGGCPDVCRKAARIAARIILSLERDAYSPAK